MVCATVSLKAQSRKERRKEELELLREMKQDEDEEKEEALREAQKKITISRFKLIFDVLNSELLVKLSSEVVFCMEKYRYKLQEVRFYENMNDLKKYAPNTPLNKMPEVSLSKQVELHFDKEITIRVGFSYNDDDGDNKYIQLLSGNNDFDKKIKEFQTLKALEPLGKFKSSALDYREADESKVSKGSRYIDLVYDYIDINKVVFESKANTLVEAKVLGNQLANDVINHNTNSQDKDIIVKLDKSQIEAKEVLGIENEKAAVPKTNKIPAYKPRPEEPVFNEPAQKQKEEFSKYSVQQPSLLPKIIVGVVGVGGMGFAYLTKTRYDKKLSDMNAMVERFDKDPTGKIYQQSDYENYKSRFNETQKLKTPTETKIMIGLGVAGVALLAETYLFIKKPRQRKISLNPTSNGAQLTFKF